MKFETKQLLLLSVLLLVVLGTVLFPQFAYLLYLPTIALFIASFGSFWQANAFPRWQLGMAVLALTCLVFLKPLLAETEFWGEESGVIMIAQSSFSEIASRVLLYHIVVPPLDYQNLHFWLVLTKHVPVIEREFYWRLPYFFFHVAAAIVFAHLIFKVNQKLPKIEQKTVTWLSFLLYFSQPLLFTYGIEIRFYTFALLCSLTLLHEVLLNQEKHWRWLCIAILASLNMASFGIYVLSLALPKLAQLWFTQQRKAILWWLPIILIEMIIAIGFNLTLLMPNQMVSFAWYQLRLAWEGFFKTNQPLLILGGAFTLMAILQKNFRDQALANPLILALLSSSLYSLAILASFIIHPHSDIGVRHFILALPGLLFVTCQLLILWHKKLAILILAIIVALQGWSIFQGMHQHKLVGKDTYHAKSAVQVAKAKNIPMVLLLSTDLPPGYADFFILSFKWYADQYHTEFFSENMTDRTCEKVAQNPQVVYIKEVRTPLPCDWSQTTLFEF